MTTAPNELESITPKHQPDEEGRMIAIGLCVLLAIDIAIILFILLAVGVPSRDVVLLIALVIGATFFMCFLVARIMWIPWQRKYPKRPILDGAVSKSMQSFAFPRLCWFNNCLRITVDEEHLHMSPFVLFSPFGAKRLSIPWDRITDVEAGFWPGLLKAKLDGRPISGPSWCLKLAQSDT